MTTPFTDLIGSIKSSLDALLADRDPPTTAPNFYIGSAARIEHREVPRYVFAPTSSDYGAARYVGENPPQIAVRSLVVNCHVFGVSIDDTLNRVNDLIAAVDNAFGRKYTLVGDRWANEREGDNQLDSVECITTIAFSTSVTNNTRPTTAIESVGTDTDATPPPSGTFTCG